MFSAAKSRQDKHQEPADTSIIDTIDDVSSHFPLSFLKKITSSFLETAGVSGLPNMLERSRVIHKRCLQELQSENLPKLPDFLCHLRNTSLPELRQNLVSSKSVLNETL